MKFIKLFKEQTAFDEAKSTLDRPNVSLVKENNNVYLLKKKNANGYSYVDLGLPSGTLWATMNVGATSETDYGNYFMWGSTEPNTADECTWVNAPFNNGSSDYDSTYFNSVKDTVCPNRILAKEYDTATQIMGGNWRMPTTTEYQTLYNETLWVWCPGGNVGIKKTDEGGNESIKYIAYPSGYFVFKTESDKKQTGTFTTDEKNNLIGYTATSGTVYYPGAHEVTEGDITSIADSDTHIFFSANGLTSGTGVNFRGSYGYYWSSSLRPSYSDYGLLLRFNSGDVNPQGSNDRYLGFCVRSVCM